MIKKYNIEIKWALIFFAAALIWMLFERIIGLHDAHIDKHSTYTNIFAIPAILIYVLALLDKRKNFYGGVMSFKQGFISGLIITVIVAVLSPLSQVIVSEIISPDYFSNIIDYSVDQGYMDLEDAQKYFSLGSYIIQAFIGALIMGIITSTIVAAFVRKKKVSA